MNAQRRNRLRAACRQLEQVKTDLELVCEKIDTIRDEEDEARDNMPENLQYSERYEESEDCSRLMDSATECITATTEYIDSAIENIEQAI